MQNAAWKNLFKYKTATCHLPHMVYRQVAGLVLEFGWTSSRLPVVHNSITSIANCQTVARFSWHHVTQLKIDLSWLCGDAMHSQCRLGLAAASHLPIEVAATSFKPCVPCVPVISCPLAFSFLSSKSGTTSFPIANGMIQASAEGDDHPRHQEMCHRKNPSTKEHHPHWRFYFEAASPL